MTSPSASSPPTASSGALSDFLKNLPTHNSENFNLICLGARTAEVMFPGQFTKPDDMQANSQFWRPPVKRKDRKFKKPSHSFVYRRRYCHTKVFKVTNL